MDRIARLLRWIFGFGEIAHLSRASSEWVRQEGKLRHIYLGDLSAKDYSLHDNYPISRPHVA